VAQPPPAWCKRKRSGRAYGMFALSGELSGNDDWPEQRIGSKNSGAVVRAGGQFCRSQPMSWTPVHLRHSSQNMRQKRLQKIARKSRGTKHSAKSALAGGCVVTKRNESNMHHQVLTYLEGKGLATSPVPAKRRVTQ